MQVTLRISDLFKTLGPARVFFLASLQSVSQVRLPRAARGAQNAEVLLFAGEEEMRVLCSLALIASAAAEGHDGHDHGGASYERVAASESTRFNES